MESLPENNLIKLPANAIQEIRKIHNLDKPGRIEEAVDILEKWLLKQDHILKKDFGRDYLERTLIASKGSVEKAKKQIDSLCTMKTLLPQYFTITNVKLQLLDMLELAWLVPLPIVTPDFYRIFMIKINHKQFTEKHFLDYFRYNIVLCEYLKGNDYVNGFIIVYDYRELDLYEVVTKLNTVELQQYMAILIEGFGARLKGIYMVTQSKIIDLFVKLLKPCLSQKIGNRINVYKSFEELHEVIPKEILPVEYGGNERSIAELRAEWLDELCTEKHVDYMKMMNKACTNESLRSADKFNEDYMGMPGSFRKLTVD